MTEQKKIPPKEEWVNLTVSQLYELKSDLTNRYYDMRQVNASFASQFLNFVQTVDAIIAYRQTEGAEKAATHQG